MYEIPYLKELFKSVKKTPVDDVFDRIVYFWTTAYCVIFATITGSKMYFGSPIDCMMPAEYNGAWTKYASQYCYITTTYENDKVDEINTINQTHSYYQWVPTILILQGLSLFLPHIFWKYAQKEYGIDFEHTVIEAQKIRYMMETDRNVAIKKLIAYLKTHIVFQRRNGKTSYAGFGYLNAFFHILSKLLTAAVIWGNISFMNHVFGKNQDTYWGYTMAYNTLTNPNWEGDGFFPRVTYCHFLQKQLGNIMPRSAPCVLMANMLNEKIFVFLWLWLALVLIVTILNVIYTIGIFFVPSLRQLKGKYFLKPIISYGSGSMSLSNTGYEHVDNMYIESFVEEVLGADGIQLLLLIKEHAGSYVASKIACELYDALHKTRNESTTTGSNNSEAMFMINNKA